MKEQIFRIISQTTNLDWIEILIRILLSMVLGAIIFFSYWVTHHGTVYSKKFSVSLIVLTILTGTVMTVIGNNITLSLGMVGALSIVRFRTAIKDVIDTVYIFWAIIVGICCGVGDFAVAGIGSVITFIAFMIVGFVKNDKRIILIVRGNKTKLSGVQSQIYLFFGKKATLKVRNTTEDSFEMIYQVPVKNEEALTAFTDMIYQSGEVEYANFVAQTDEISN